MTTLIFSPLSSTSSLLRNPNSTFFVRDFSAISISISNNRKNNLISGGSFRVSARATALPLLDAETNRPDASGRSIHLEISKIGISEEIVSALSRRGITELFPIQRAVLDPAMEGRDMIGRAITGSGKTLAFAIPILEKIIRHRRPQRQKRIPSALVLAPTRELARQVQKEFKESAPNLSSVCLYGGVPITNQVRVLGFGIDIAVGTPGRIIDLVERGALNLSEVKFVVLDEADQMLAVGFQEDVENILNYLPAKKQCMLFSATMPSWVNELSRKYLRDPLVVDLVGDSDQKLADGISLYSVVSTASGKESILPTLISKYGRGGKSIIFTKTKKDAEELSRSMGSMLASRALHGNMQQFQRDKTLAAFRDGRFSVLVATDVAARGLDIPNVDLVIHFEIPNSSEIFVHRSGRTGRAGNKGTAVLIYTKAQSRNIRLIERDLGFRFEELPRITDGIANVTRSRTPDRSIYGRYDDSDHFSENRFGSYGESREFTYDNVSKTKNQYEGRFGGYDSSRKNPNSRNSSLRTTRFAKSRISQLNDIKRNHMVEKKAVEGRKPNDFKEILDMLKDMS